MRELLAAQKVSLRTLTDLVAGAIDARLNPQGMPAIPAGRKTGVETMVKLLRCAPDGVSMQDQRRSAAWMIGGTIALTLVSIVLLKQIGPNSLSEGLMYAAFPASLSLSSQCTYLNRYSTAARRVMSIGGAVLIILVVWAATAIAYLL